MTDPSSQAYFKRMVCNTELRYIFYIDLFFRFAIVVSLCARSITTPNHIYKGNSMEQKDMMRYFLRRILDPLHIEHDLCLRWGDDIH